jgi:hypothetical protein
MSFFDAGDVAARTNKRIHQHMSAYINVRRSYVNVCIDVAARKSDAKSAYFTT